MTNAALRGKPDAGNPHVRFDEGEVALAATPRRGSLLYRTKPMLMGVLALGCACVFGNEAKDLGVNVDGVHLEEADSIKPVVDEKPCELKVVNGDVGAKGKSTSDVSKTDEVKLPYEVVDGAIVLGRSRLLPRRPLRRLRNPEDGKHAAAKISSGTLVIPDVIDGLPVRGIGYGALSDCKGVTSVAIPSSVTNIVDNAFSGFDEIMSFSVDAANPSYSSRDGLLCTKDGTTLVLGVNGEVTIPSCVKSIWKAAFKDHNGLTSVTIPASVTNIGEWAFAGCNGLKSVRIPSSVTNIAEGAFAGCKEITSFSVDADNPSYSSRDGLLYSKDGTTLLAVVKGTVTISYEVVDGAVILGAQRSTLRRLTRRNDGKSVVAKNSSGALIIPDVIDGLPVRCIGYGALSDCKGVTSVAIPSSVTNIVDGAFSGCNEITSFSVDAANPSYSSRDGLLCSKDGTTLVAGIDGEVTIPSCVTSIGSGAFNGRDGLTSVTIPDGVTNIGYNAFNDCGGLKSLTLPSSLKVVGMGAFGRCVGLTSVEIPEGVTSIQWCAFMECGGLKSVVIPDSVTSIGALAFIYCRELTTVTIPAKVASIGEGAFGGCGKLKQINLAAGNQAFTLVDGVLYKKDMSVLLACPGIMTSVAIPSGVTKIGAFAFRGCNALASVAIPEGVTSIQWCAFMECGGLKSVTIPASVKVIGPEVFKDCVELASVTMRGERPEAPNNIFKGCGKLKSIHAPANAKSWEGMKEWLGIPLVFDAK